MQKIVIFLILFFTCQFSFSKELLEIDRLVNGKYNQIKFKNEFENELALYRATKKHKHLLNAKYIEAFIFGNNGDENKRILKLLWVIEHSKDEDYLIYTYANYHLSSELSVLGSNTLALKYSNTALKNCIKFNITSLLHFTFSLEGAIYYKTKNYKSAITSYFKALETEKEKDYLFRASMLNNISLCKMNLKELDASNLYIEKSLSNLSKIKNKTFDDNLFKIIVEGNLGSNYFAQGNHERAKPLLENELNFYEKNNQNLSSSFNLLNELLKIYIKDGTPPVTGMT